MSSISRSPGSRLSGGTQNGPSVTLYLTLFGIGASFLSTFWAYQYTRLAKRLRLYATRGPQGAEGRLTKASVRKQLWQVPELRGCCQLCLLSSM